ncbi:hypothetical protein NUW58_g7111 [Xylaria curta]|uniref:Uncharacterized protein n=1 Tax=Xylaria curta TaxID=42375 RepID=A0ACC1NKD2_9PEZI|nr:hypothetical protein NUW58_g7111 [Xylaria curta]
MASSSATATADTLINIKVNLDGSTRRFKLPLRDLGANTFEDKLRAFLSIPVDTITVIERYSDSATTFVTLSPTNVSVYKQLYRAAKAKQKLKLRVTTKPIVPVQEVHTPKPVTVEDEPEEDSHVSTVAQVEAQKEPEIEVENELVQSLVNGSSGVVETIVAPKSTQDFPSFVKQWRARGTPRIHLRRDGRGAEVIDFLGPSTSTDPLITRDPEEPNPSATSIQDVYNTTLGELMREACEKELSASQQREKEIGKLKEANARKSVMLSKDEAKELIQLANPAMEETKAKETGSSTIGHQDCMKRPFTVCCNSCDQAVPEAHFHCSICDEGDFDLCQDCVNRGISCYGDGHWLIKRTVVNGDIKSSSTHIAPKSVRTTTPKPTPSPVASSVSSLTNHSPLVLLSAESDWTTDYNAHYNARTCNCCVQEFREEEFVHCTSCDDYDLCKTCFAKNQHGHHPKHGFTAAVKGTVLSQQVSSRLAPGRNVLHNAICDGCDKYVRGIRHKCLDCPDWDYCSDCVKDAGFIHANHRFVAIYEPLADRPFRTSSRATHYGISCDGPLCSTRASGSKYIVGERYKCAVCHDTDFCANCEASPANTHNKTHPLIKFKTPVRHVSVTTTGEHEDGQRLPAMGDKCYRARTSTQSPNKSASRENIVATPVQTVVDVQPTEQVAPFSSHKKSAEIKEESSEVKTSISAKASVECTAPTDLVAAFKWDTIQDGSVLPPNHTFEQTWVLRNEGMHPWPAGCSVKFVGGDYMGAVDPAHPAGIHELVSASESTVCYNALNPGQEFPFTVLMRTPDRDGKVISYWRLTTADGVKFGHKLWCDVTVQTLSMAKQAKVQAPAVIDSQTEVEDTAPATIEGSRMIIPKLDHESPSGSIHEARSEVEVETETDTLAPSADDDDGFEDCGAEDEWAEDSDNGFLTDEEYDILDASDEEFLFEQQRKLSKN